MPDPTTIPSKRDIRRQNRETKLNEQLQSEAGKYGIDLGSQYTTPNVEESKQAITQPVISSYPTQKENIENFAAGYVNPSFTGQPQLDQEALKRQLKKQKVAKIGDILSALGQGLQGKRVDPNSLVSKQMQSEREQQYLNYRNIAEANKQAAATWENKYRTDLLNFIDGKLKSAATTEADKLKLDKIKADIEATQAKADLLKTQEKWQKNKPYYQPRQGAQANEPYATYQYKTADGQTITIPMPGEKNRAYQFTNSIMNLDKLKAERKRIKDQMDADITNAESTGMGGFLGWGQSQEDVISGIQDQYQPQLSDIDAQISSLENQFLNSFNPNPAPTGTQKQTAPSKPRNPLEEAIQEAKKASTK